MQYYESLGKDLDTKIKKLIQDRRKLEYKLRELRTLANRIAEGKSKITESEFVRLCLEMEI
jgi:hypothetical protein